MEKLLNTQLKNGEMVYFKLKEEDHCLYSITVYDDTNLEIASVWFYLKNRTCYVNRIEVKTENYSHMGIGTMLLNHMEKFATKNYCYNVDGRFYPFGELGKYARAFYIKNNYHVYKDGYETYISKTLTRTNNEEKTF